jgi:malonyl-CoA/methylmalonyl-CoA synthetase
VIHGRRDPLVLPSGGSATAAAIPGAILIEFDEMGHEVPRHRWLEITAAIRRNAKRTRAPSMATSWQAAAQIPAQIVLHQRAMTTNANLARELHDQYRAAKDQPFLRVPGDRAYTYGDIHDRAGRFAGALRTQGIEAGDRVIVTAPKSVDAVALYLACLRIGAVYVPLNPALTTSELDFYVHDADPAIMVIDSTQPSPHAVPTLTLDGGGAGSLPEAATDVASVDDAVMAAPDDVAAMLYTSGTTGRPKGAMLTHRGLSSNGKALNKIWGFEPGDVLVHALPIFHVHGLFVALHCAMFSAAEVLFLARFDIDRVLEALPNATVLMGVPTHYARLLADDRFGSAACHNMRLFTSGSAPMTKGIHDTFTGRTGHRILERYGMSEAGIITSNPLDGDRVAGTVGFALPDMEMRVATDAGLCPPGNTGMVEVRGPHLFAGYWRQPAKTASEHRPDGWFMTGDVGAIDAEGRLTLEGRSSDMIISGGENIYPKEIELCLDAIDSIVESAVVGHSDPDFGEAVVAFLVVEAGFDLMAVQTGIAGQLARFKHPKRYIVVDELPRNAMGKVQKADLRTRQR